MLRSIQKAAPRLKQADVTRGVDPPAMGYREWMRKFTTIFGALLVLGGTVWILQGLNVGFAPRSFMSGNSQWVAYGSITVLAGVGLGIYGLRGNR